MDPATGALPRVGHCDDSALADLSLRGPHDARGSVERAMRLFADASAGHPDDPGCVWLDLPARGPGAPLPAAWRSEGWLGLSSAGAYALLRTGAPLRFRPGHADLLHLELRDGPRALLRDGGSGAYNPPPAQAWWHAHLTGTAAHNTIAFDGADQMPCAGRFLFARWPRTEALPDGAAYADHRGNRHARMVRTMGRTWHVEDRVAGPFREIVVRWRLAPGDWEPNPDGVAGPHARLSVTADALLETALVQGWESPAYGVVTPAPVLEVRARAPISRLLAVIRLPEEPVAQQDTDLQPGRG